MNHRIRESWYNCQLSFSSEVNQFMIKIQSCDSKVTIGKNTEVYRSVQMNQLIKEISNNCLLGHFQVK